MGVCTGHCVQRAPTQEELEEHQQPEWRGEDAEQVRSTATLRPGSRGVGRRLDSIAKSSWRWQPALAWLQAEEAEGL